VEGEISAPREHKTKITLSQKAPFSLHFDFSSLYFLEIKSSDGKFIRKFTQNFIVRNLLIISNGISAEL